MRRDVYQAIADPVRRDIIQLLAKQSMNVTSVAQHYDISRPAISRHLRILRECGIVKVDKLGRQRMCKIEPSMLKLAFNWMDQYKDLWNHNPNNIPLSPN